MRVCLATRYTPPPPNKKRATICAHISHTYNVIIFNVFIVVSMWVEATALGEKLVFSPIVCRYGSEKVAWCWRFNQWTAGVTSLEWCCYCIYKQCTQNPHDWPNVSHTEAPLDFSFFYSMMICCSMAQIKTITSLLPLFFFKKRKNWKHHSGSDLWLHLDLSDIVLIIFNKYNHAFWEFEISYILLMTKGQS